MHRRAALGIATVLAALAAGCGGDDTSSTAGRSTAAPADEATAFCDSWTTAMASGEDIAFDEVLARAPAELQDEAALVRDANHAGSESPEAEAAAAEILNWVELHCERGEPCESQRHIAPPIDADLGDLTFCGTTAFPRSPRDNETGIVLYGPANADDPYDGPMLGVFWNPLERGGHAGDGDSQPVTVRGQSGVAAPITVFQQTILPDLGSVIAWMEGDRAFGLYGRRWAIDRKDELEAIANRLEETDGRFRIPDDALPDGYVEVLAGDPSVTSLVLAPSPLYSLRYTRQAGLLDVNGLQMTDDEFEAFRFFTVGVDHGEVAGRDGLVGNAWHEQGPAVLTWREPDGLVVRIVGIGVPLKIARHVADQSRELTDDEWAALVETEDNCEDK